MTSFEGSGYLGIVKFYILGKDVSDASNIPKLLGDCPLGVSN